MTGETKRSRNRSCFILWNLTHRKFHRSNDKKKLRKRKENRYFECEIPVETPATVPENPEYYNPNVPDTQHYHDERADSSGCEVQRSAGVFTSRPPAAVLQHPLTLSRPPPADIMSRLQSLTPIRPIICRLQMAAVQESITDT